MNAIHTHAELFPTCELGSQTYDGWVVQKERTGEHKFLSLCFFVFPITNCLACRDLTKMCFNHFSCKGGRSESSGLCRAPQTVQRGSATQQHHSHVWCLQLPEQIPRGGEEEKNNPGWWDCHKNYRHREIPRQIVWRYSSICTSPLNIYTTEKIIETK